MAPPQGRFSNSILPLIEQKSLLVWPTPISWISQRSNLLPNLNLFTYIPRYLDLEVVIEYLDISLQFAAKITYFFFQFLQQYTYFLSTLEVFKLQPDGVSKGLDSLVMFIASISHCYPEELASFPQLIMDLLRTHHMVLNSELRLVSKKANLPTYLVS